MLGVWEQTNEFPFSVQVWSPESGVQELFAREPAVYEAIYGQPPSGELRAAAEQSVAIFRERLGPAPPDRPGMAAIPEGAKGVALRK